MKCNDCVNFQGLTADGLSMCRIWGVSDKGLLSEFLHERPNKGCKDKRLPGQKTEKIDLSKIRIDHEGASWKYHKDLNLVNKRRKRK